MSFSLHASQYSSVEQSNALACSIQLVFFKLKKMIQFKGLVTHLANMQWQHSYPRVSNK